MFPDSCNRIINEGVEEYIEGINTLDDLHGFAKDNKSFVIYSRTWSRNIDAIKKTGVSREFIGSNGAHVYGFGLYCTTTLEGELDPGMASSYGDVIMKIVVPGFDRCLIDQGVRATFTNDLAKMAHGSLSFEQQVDKLVKDPRDAQKLKRYGSCAGLVRNWSQIDDSIFHHYDIDGLFWNNGGDWGLWKDFKRVIPYQYTKDDGRTWIPLATQDTVDVTANTYEPSVAFGKEFKNYFMSDPHSPNKVTSAENLRCVNGYFLVQSSKGYNLVNPKTKQPASPVWFDLCSDVDKNGLAIVKYKGTYYYYQPSENVIYEYTTDPVELEEKLDFGDYLCTPEELKQQNIAESKSRQLKEGIDEYVPDVEKDEVDYNPNEDSKFFYFYRLAPSKQTESIAKNGFTKEFRGTGNDNSDFLGSGTYGCQYKINTPRVYGDTVWCYATPKNIVANGYITPHPWMAEKYGIQGTYEEQIQRFFPEQYKRWAADGTLRGLLDIGRRSGSQVIRRLLDALVNAPLGSDRGIGGRADHAVHAAGVKGFLYDGNVDHNAVLTTDDGTIIPISYKNLANPNDTWHKVDIDDQLWDRTYNRHDPLAFIGGNYRDYVPTMPNNDSGNNDWRHQLQSIIDSYRVINGYMLVKRRSDGKYNLIKAPEGRKNFASPVWFDMCSDVDENGLSWVKYNGTDYYYQPSEHVIYEHEPMDDVLEKMDFGDYLCTDSELENL